MKSILSSLSSFLRLELGFNGKFSLGQVGVWGMVDTKLLISLRAKKAQLHAGGVRELNRSRYGRL